MKVLSVSSGRADVGILAPVWRALAARTDVELHVMLTGAHVTDDSAVRAVLPHGTTGHTEGADMGGRDGLAASDAMARISDAAGRLAARIAPDRALLMGDRLDMLPAAMGLVPLNIPLAHLHGGELTYGATDDRARHAITKLSHLHCTATVEAAKRVAQMGEEGWRIQVTGAPGLDSLVQAPVIDRAMFARTIGFEQIDGLRLVTIHPETNAADPLAALDATLAALRTTPRPTLFTAPNADPGGEEARKRINEFVVRHDWAVLCDTLGVDLFANALRHATTMVGNSSSGIIEAELFGLPVINIGSRQSGRARASNVRDCAADPTAVERMLRSVPGRFPPSHLYGDGYAAPKVADFVTEPHDIKKLLYKYFMRADVAASDGALCASERVVAPKVTIATRSTIVRALRELGVTSGETLCVHSSLGALGYVPDGARTVIDALLEVLGKEGTLMMPTYSGDLSNPAEWRHPSVPENDLKRVRDDIAAYDPRLTPTRRMGTIAEYFRNHPDALRSAHPQSSFSAMGNRASEIIDGHSLDNRFGKQSPLAKLVALRGKVLMLGAPWNTCSLFYLTQHLERDAPKFTRATPVLIEGRRRWVEYQDIAYSNVQFPALINKLIESGIANRRRVLEADSVIFPAAQAIDAVLRWLSE